MGNAHLGFSRAQWENPGQTANPIPPPSVVKTEMVVMKVVVMVVVVVLMAVVTSVDGVEVAMKGGTGNGSDGWRNWW